MKLGKKLTQNIKNERICEYCDIKQKNSQIEEFYHLGRNWRKKDQEILNRKIAWYKEKTGELETQVELETEAISLVQAAAQREFGIL